MSSIAVFLCLLVILVSGLKELIVKLGEDAPLQCQGPRDAEITLLEWNRADLKSDDYVFLYRNQRSYESYQHKSFKGRVNLMDPTMRDGNVSVMLRNINAPRSPRLSPQMEERGLSVCLSSSSSCQFLLCLLLILCNCPQNLKNVSDLFTDSDFCSSTKTNLSS
ncbi:uncharacterized protein LOC134623677 isoform X2 [Pelmatolapia mariae]|uniref:uncharacterized protein LOC134623677 isoform X2 n=1 Tax=Pelmatolapia mariae TaxID=158779 RepID=UPI002FE67769